MDDSAGAKREVLENTHLLRWEHMVRPTIVTHSYCRLIRYMEWMWQPSILAKGRQHPTPFNPSTTWHLIDDSAGSEPEVLEHGQQLMGWGGSMRPTNVTHSCCQIIMHMGRIWQHSTGQWAACFPYHSTSVAPGTWWRILPAPNLRWSSMINMDGLRWKHMVRPTIVTYIYWRLIGYEQWTVRTMNSENVVPLDWPWADCIPCLSTAIAYAFDRKIIGFRT